MGKGYIGLTLCIAGLLGLIGIVQRNPPETTASRALVIMCCGATITGGAIATYAVLTEEEE